MLNFVKFFPLIFICLVFQSCSPKKAPEPALPVQQSHEHLHGPQEAVGAPAPHPHHVHETKTAPYLLSLHPSSASLNTPTRFHLKIETPEGQAVKHKQFKINHGKRIHALVVDPSLQDYQHLHLRPLEGETLAEYEFSLTPTQPGDYKITLDVVDLKNKHYYLETQFSVPGNSQKPVFAPALTQQIQGLQFELDWSGPLRAKQPLTLGITVKQQDKLFRQLQPTMQAYAHLIGYSADRTQLLHAHPLGEEPVSSNQRGGPNLKFGLEFPKPGYYRLFLQIKVKGKDVFVPFDVKVS